MLEYVPAPVPTSDDIKELKRYIDQELHRIAQINLPTAEAVAEVNDLTDAVTWDDVPDANITESSVVQHEGALTITESQISDLDHTPAGYNNSNWDTAYGWGDHAGAYLPIGGGTVTGNIYQSPSSASISNQLNVTTNAYDVDTQYRIGGTLTALHRWDSSANTFTWMDRAPSNVLAMTLNLEDQSLAVVGNVTGANLNVSNWDTAYGWGNHASAGYLTAVPATHSPYYATEMSAAQDLDDLIGPQAGFYHQTSNADTSGNNYPNGHAGSLLVQRAANSGLGATQLYITYPDTGNKMFFRSEYTTGYGAWHEVVDCDQTQTISGSKTFTASATTLGGTTVNINNSGNLNISAAATQITTGKILRILDAGNTDHVQFSHDGTDFNILGTNTTDINITGITALKTSGSLYVGGDATGHFETVSGQYGSVQVDGVEGSASTWRGYSIGARHVFMDNGSTTCGIYNDTDNQWHIICVDTGAVTLYYGSGAKLATTSTGASVTGNLQTTGNVELGHASDTTLSRVSAGKIEVEGRPVYTNESSSYDSGRVHFSTSAPTGGDGSNGDIWFEYTT